jgi:4a-hydroxytetrahydrobiopterin dehydratase
LEELDDWNIKEGKLNKNFEFSNFIHAFGFITKIALEAEKIEHHPEIHNVYNKVEISLSTHDIHGISEYDFNMAKSIDKVILD